MELTLTNFSYKTNCSKGTVPGARTAFKGAPSWIPGVPKPPHAVG